MSSAKNKYSVYQGLIQDLIKANLKQGISYPECPIQTVDNVKVADVVWVSSARYQQIKNEDVCSIASEICIKIKSAANTNAEMMFKKDLYFQAGAKEFWLCNENGDMSFYNKERQLNTLIVQNFPVRIEI